MSEQLLVNPRRSVWPVFMAIVFGMLLVSFLGWWFVLRAPDSKIPIAFDDTSDELQRTVILPTLDTPMPEGKNVIWCASFQLAWNKLKNEVAGGAVRVDKDQQIADRLNDAAQSEEDLPDGASYSAAGFDRDGIADKIRGDMARLFPGTPVTLPAQHPQGVTAYGYLRTSVTFTQPFLELEKGFRFADGAGVGGFGFAHEHEGAYRKLRSQMDVLYFTLPDEDSRPGAVRYAVDLCKDALPNQIVLARLPRGATLAETLADHQKLATTEPREGWQGERRFRRDDELRVPNMHWRIEHQFRELLGRTLLNEPVKGLYIDTAIQVIEFNLDRSGAGLASQAAIHAKGGPREFFFDRPFLLYVKKREGKHPFFVMWVENDELLQRK